MSSKESGKVASEAKKKDSFSSTDEAAQIEPDLQEVKPLPPSSWYLKMGLPVLVHFLIIGIYLYPILKNKGMYYPSAVLDEVHIMDENQPDIRGSNSWTEAFGNDYWGRSMHYASSHKSWRPLTVLSFRYFRPTRSNSPVAILFVHRLVNVMVHATVAELVGITATLLFPPFHHNPNQQWLLQCLAKLIFGLHPTHVEVTANAANRNHLLAVLCSVLLVDPNCHILAVMLLFAAGLMCSETFLFQVPAIFVTLLAIQYQQQRRKLHEKSLLQQNKKKNMIKTTKAQTKATSKSNVDTRGEENDEDTVSWIDIFAASSPRLLAMVLLTIMYVVGRWAFNTLDIPEGLIRPAENPFYRFTGFHRVINYAYVLSIHIGKSVLIDPVGFSHEYGFECIREISSPDWRLLVPCGIFLIAVAVTLYGIQQYRGKQRTKHEDPSFLLLWLVYLSWLATLFPVSGVVKVGTFIADRIVVASTVAFSMFAAHAITSYLTTTTRQAKGAPCSFPWKTRTIPCVFLVAILVFYANKVKFRSLQWMDSLPLLKSSLVSCPRASKSHLELSKVYSGLYPKEYDLERTRYHLDQVEAIDPDYCDTNFQFAQLELKERNVLGFEERIAKAVTCKFTMEGAADLFRKYWEVATKPETNDDFQGAIRRYNKYKLQIESRIEAEVKQEGDSINGNGRKQPDDMRKRHGRSEL